LSNRELKVSEKALSKKAKENGRANRDEEMDFFAAYYKEKFQGTKFVAFKKAEDHPWRIQKVLADD
jgi:hypothetical protein